MGLTYFLNVKTCFPYPTMAVSSRGPRSRAGLIAYPTERFNLLDLSYRRKNNVPVCIPNEAPMPKTTRKRTSGASPAGGGPFFLSFMASITIIRTVVPKNSSKNAETFVI